MLFKSLLLLRVVAGRLVPQEGGFAGDWKLISQAGHEIIRLNYHRRVRLCGAHSDSLVEERQQHLLPGSQPMHDPSVSQAAPESEILSESCASISAQEERRGLSGVGGRGEGWIGGGGSRWRWQGAGTSRQS